MRIVFGAVHVDMYEIVRDMYYCCAVNVICVHLAPNFYVNTCIEGVSMLATC